MVEKAMATHSRILAWKIPQMEKPARLQSMGWLRVGHNFTFTFHFHALEKEMATHSSVLAWRIPGMGEPGGLPSMGSHRVNWSNLAAAVAAEWQGGEGNGNPLQYSCLENTMDRGAWSFASVHRVAQSWTKLKWLSMHACVREGNGNHSSILSWRIPGTEDPGGLLSMGSHRVWHDWSDLAAAAEWHGKC